MRFQSVAAAALITLAVPLVLVATAPTALACSCAMIDSATKIGSATVVFSGRALSHVEPTAAVVISTDPVPWTFAVDRVYKGTPAPQQIVVTAMSGASCGAELLDGREYLVLGSGTDPVETTLCSGTQELAGVPSDVTAALGPGQTFPPPAPAPIPAPTPELPAWLVLMVVAAGAGIGLVMRRRRRS